MRKLRTKRRSEENTLYALYKIKEISSFLKITTPMGIIPSSSFKHFVSNFIIAKGAFGYADGVAYYHSENARRIPRIIFFFGQ